MKPSAILYNSNTGFTERYAKMLGEKTGLPVFFCRKPAEKGSGGDTYGLAYGRKPFRL